MLLARHWPEKLKPDEEQLLAKLNECCPEIPIPGYDLTQGFATVFRDKQSDTLQTWLDQAKRNRSARKSRTFVMACSATRTRSTPLSFCPGATVRWKAKFID